MQSLLSWQIFAKTSSVHPGQFCKTHSALGIRNAECAEALANMAETTNEHGCAFTEDYHSSVIENEILRKPKCNQDNWKKKTNKPNQSHNISLFGSFPRESLKVVEVLLVCAVYEIYLILQNDLC